MEQVLFPIEALLAGKTILRKSWQAFEEMKLVKPDEWEGPYDIGSPMVMKKDKSGSWSIWCNCISDILATDWVIK